MLQVAIKSNIKAVLEEKDMTPYRLAKMIGKHTNHVYALAGKEYIPDGTALKTMVDIAQALGVQVDQLFTVEN